MVLTQGYGMNILGFPGATVTPMEKTPLLTNLVFIPLSRAVGIPGVLGNQIVFGVFKVVWKVSNFCAAGIRSRLTISSAI